MTQLIYTNIYANNICILILIKLQIYFQSIGKRMEKRIANHKMSLKNMEQEKIGVKRPHPDFDQSIDLA